MIILHCVCKLVLHAPYVLGTEAGDCHHGVVAASVDGVTTGLVDHYIYAHPGTGLLTHPFLAGLMAEPTETP